MKLAQRYKSFIYHLKDKKIERKQVKIENVFKKTMPKIQETSIQD